MQKYLLAGCNVCGRNHTTELCSFLRELKPVEDTKTPSRARLTLPANLEVQNLADNSTTVVARAPFVRSVQFGPFIARHTQMLHPAVNFPLKVFGKTEETSYYLDTSDEEACNWMCLVAPATSCKEQNLICYQMGQDIYYTVMKDIQAGEQLKVWYAPYYAVKMGAVPFSTDFTADANGDKSTDHVYESKQKLREKEKKNFHGMLLSREVTQKLAEQLPARQLGARQTPDRWRCKLCCAEETSVILFARHLMSHYKRSVGHSGRLLECHLCHQKFATEKLLVKHKVIRHKMVLQRPRLLGDIEEDESAGVDMAEEENDDMLEDRDGKVTSIVIANLTGQLPSHFSQPGSQTIFVTNTGRLLTDGMADSELQERQHEALNVLLEQLQSTDTYQDGNEVQFGPETVDYYTNNELESTNKCKVPQKINSRCNVLKNKTQENVSILQDGLEEKDMNLVLNDTNVASQFETMQEEEEDTGPGGILTEYKPETATGLALNHQQNNRENIINIINTHVTIIHNGSMMSSDDQSESAHTDDVRNPVDKPKVHNTSIFEEFQTSNVVPEEMVPKPSTALGVAYQTGADASVSLQAGSTSDERCVINPDDLETVATSSELSLPVGQEDVSSAFLGLVSEPDIDTADAQNLDKHAGSAEGQDDISLSASFDLNDVSDGTSLLPADNAKTVDLGPPYNCDICNKEFHKADYLYRHLRKHTGEFMCVSCLAVFARKESLTNHSCFADASGVNEETSSLICPYCQKKFLVKKIFKRHMAKHTGEWKCNKCQRLYSSRATLSSHRCSTKPNPVYPCHVCKREFLRRSYLDKHMLLHLENHPCTVCGKKLQSGKVLQNHQNYCRRGKQLETVGETACPHCNITFSQLVTFRQHVYQHMYPYMCQQCEERFRTDPVKVLHTCSETVLNCEMCTEQFSSLLSLSQHQVIHGVPQFHCYECGQSFHLCENYSSHICSAWEEPRTSHRKRKKAADKRDEESKSVHASGKGEMSEVLSQKKRNADDSSQSGVVCDVCGEVYKTIHILKAHMQLHGERKFACQICNKKFHRKDVLQEHHSVHQEAHIPCPLCNKKLKTKKSLDVHMHRHTGIRRYSCMDCDKVRVEVVGMILKLGHQHTWCHDTGVLLAGSAIVPHRRE
ncbi:hypothetical protein B7P43_G16366, partial [Cryptotermes secundus]